MLGDHGFVYKVTADAISGNAFVKKMSDAWDTTISIAPLSYWEVDNSITTEIFATNYLLLKAKQQASWLTSITPEAAGIENPNNQQILFEGQSDRILITYAPNGGINSSNYTNTWLPGIDPTYSILTSGRRSLGGTTTNVAHISNVNFNGTFYIVEYRDQTSTTDYPFSSLLLMFETGTNANSPWRYACHVGRIITTYNNNDAYIIGGPALTGDAVLVGLASAATATANTWLREAAGNFNSCIRVGNSWPNIETDTMLSTSPGLNDINGKPRLVPYDINVSNGGRMGKTKYLRQHKRNFGISPTLLASSNVLSQQAWAGWKDPSVLANNHNQCILWNKTFVAVP